MKSLSKLWRALVTVFVPRNQVQYRRTKVPTVDRAHWGEG